MSSNNILACNRTENSCGERVVYTRRGVKHSASGGYMRKPCKPSSLDARTKLNEMFSKGGSERCFHSLASSPDVEAARRRAEHARFYDSPRVHRFFSICSSLRPCCVPTHPPTYPPTASDFATTNACIQCVYHPIYFGHQSTPFGMMWVLQPGSHRRKVTHFHFYFVLLPTPFLLRYLPLVLNVRRFQQALPSLYSRVNRFNVKLQENTLRENRTCILTASSLTWEPLNHRGMLQSYIFWCGMPVYRFYRRLLMAAQRFYTLRRLSMVSHVSLIDKFDFFVASR
ncbi:unnamed protein product, partial [Pylaiella littoralis]